MGRFVNLSGNKYGRLTVVSICDYKKNGKIVYKCKCDCGKEIDVVGARLKNGNTKSCGCLSKEVASECNRVDLTGQRFGRLVAMYECGRNKNNKILWKCQCDCGNTTTSIVSSLKSGKKKSCGCLGRETTSAINFIDLVGRKFGRLTVEYLCNYKLNGSSVWHCKCDCGKEKDIRANHLLSGRKLSCGCYAKDINSKRLKGIRITTNDYPKWFIDDLAYECDRERARNGTMVSTEYVDFLCPIHGIYGARVTDHIKITTLERKYGCPQCSNSLGIVGSKPENEIKDFIHRLLPDVNIKKAKILEIGNRLKEIDIYIPSLRVGIEYCGSAFHASSNGAFNNKSKYYHRDKFIQAKKQGIHLITVFDKYYEENKWEIFEVIKKIIYKDTKFFIPDLDVVYTNNNYDIGDWLKEYGYIEVGQEEPSSFIYNNKYLVYECGHTKWMRCDNNG